MCDEHLENLNKVMSLYSRGTFGKDSFQWTKCVVKYLYDVYSDLSNQMIAFLVEVGQRPAPFFAAPLPTGHPHGGRLPGRRSRSCAGRLTIDAILQDAGSEETPPDLNKWPDTRFAPARHPWHRRRETPSRAASEPGGGIVARHRRRERCAQVPSCTHLPEKG